MPEEHKEKSLSTAIIVFMVVVALFYDGLQIAFSWLGLGILITPIFYLHFWLWFRMRGVKFLSLKRAPTLGVGALLELASAGLIPAFTFIVLRVALDYKLKKIAPVLDIINK